MVLPVVMVAPEVLEAILLKVRLKARLKARLKVTDILRDSLLQAEARRSRDTILLRRKVN